MIKSIKFSDYYLERELHPDYNDSQLFNSAWNKTSEGIKYNNRKKTIVKTSQLTCLAVFSFIAISNFTTVVSHASGLIDFKLIKVNEPTLWGKIENINKIFIENCQGLKGGEMTDFLVGISKNRLSPEEFTKVKELYDGLSYEEITSVLKMLNP